MGRRVGREPKSIIARKMWGRKSYLEKKASDSPKSDNIRWSSLSMIPLVCTPYLSYVTSFLAKQNDFDY